MVPLSLPGEESPGPPLFSSAFWPGVCGCREHAAGTWDFRGRNPLFCFRVSARCLRKSGAHGWDLGFPGEESPGPPLCSSAFWRGVHGCPEHAAGTWDFRGRNPPDPLFLIPRFGRASTGARSTRLGFWSVWGRQSPDFQFPPRMGAQCPAGSLGSSPSAFLLPLSPVSAGSFGAPASSFSRRSAGGSIF